MTCGSDKTLKLWNPQTGVLIKAYRGHGYEVMDAHASCDNSQLCSGGMDKCVILFDVATGNVVRKYRGHVGEYPGSKLTISGHPEFGLEDFSWTLAAHRFDVLRTSIDPKMVQILTTKI